MRDKRKFLKNTSPNSIHEKYEEYLLETHRGVAIKLQQDFSKLKAYDLATDQIYLLLEKILGSHLRSAHYYHNKFVDVLIALSFYKIYLSNEDVEVLSYLANKKTYDSDSIKRVELVKTKIYISCLLKDLFLAAHYLGGAEIQLFSSSLFGRVSDFEQVSQWDKNVKKTILTMILKDPYNKFNAKKILLICSYLFDILDMDKSADNFLSQRLDLLKLKQVGEISNFADMRKFNRFRYYAKLEMVLYFIKKTKKHIDTKTISRIIDPEVTGYLSQAICILLSDKNSEALPSDFIIKLLSMGSFKPNLLPTIATFLIVLLKEQFDPKAIKKLQDQALQSPNRFLAIALAKRPLVVRNFLNCKKFDLSVQFRNFIRYYCKLYTLFSNTKNAPGMNHFSREIAFLSSMPDRRVYEPPTGIVNFATVNNFLENLIKEKKFIFYCYKKGDNDMMVPKKIKDAYKNKDDYVANMCNYFV